MDLLAARGLPVADRVIFREIRSPRHLERDTLAPGGAIYGRALHGPLATLCRPANRTGVGGLFLVGGSTHPGGGLPLVALSARIVAQAIGRA
jgi:phytoene dehydrogenase-like protein